MKQYRFILEPAKRALILCVSSMVLALFVVVGLDHYHQGKKTAYVQSDGELQGTRSENQTLADDLASLEEHLASFNHLASIGLIGEPERERWVQNLEKIYTTLDLPPTLSYKLAPPNLLADNQEAMPGALPLAGEALRHDLAITLSDIHEDEFLAFIDRLRTDWQTPFRIETCQISRNSDNGLQIICTLRLFSLPHINVDQHGDS